MSLAITHSCVHQHATCPTSTDPAVPLNSQPETLADGGTVGRDGGGRGRGGAGRQVRWVGATRAIVGGGRASATGSAARRRALMERHWCVARVRQE
eukprot:scaffold8336_cov94-Isochrysis_galbana.AAC.2